MVKDVWVGNNTGFYNDIMPLPGGKALFGARNDSKIFFLLQIHILLVYGIEPWITDGTENGTYMISGMSKFFFISKCHRFESIKCFIQFFFRRIF